MRVSSDDMKLVLAKCSNSLLVLLFLATGATAITNMPWGFVDVSPIIDCNQVLPEQQAFRHSPLFMSPSRARIKSKLQKLKNNQSPTHTHQLTGEPAGITPSIGLWKEFRRLLRVRRQQPLKDTLDYTKLSFLLKSEGRRRKKIKERLKKLGYKFSLKKDGKVELENTNAQLVDEEEDEYNQYSLDGLRATAGVLRTRIRLKQDELKELEVLMKDVVREMRMEGFLDKKQTDKEVEVRKVTDTMTTISTTLGNGGMMGEDELYALNDQWKNKAYNTEQISNDESNEDERDDDELVYEFQLDLMKTRATEIQSQILLDRVKLQRLERRILCCESTELGLLERAVGNTLDTLNESEFLADPIAVIRQRARKFTTTFGESSSVLFRRIDRESYTSDAKERDLESLSDFVVKETSAGIRIGEFSFVDS